MDKDTVSIYFVKAAVRHVPPAALPAVLRAAGIPPEMLAQRQARVPARDFAALWLAVAHELDDEFFGLDRRRMKVGSFALACRAALPSGSLGRALRQCLRAFAVFLDDLHGELAVHGERAVITLHGERLADPADRRFAEETFLVLVHGLMCWLAGRRLRLRRAAFAYPRPEEAREYRVMFCEELAFDAARTAVEFDAALLDAPVVQTEAGLKAFLRSAPQSVFLKYKSADGWTARVRRRLRRGLDAGHWPTLEALADEFHVAPSTLRRRLDAEGATYQSVKDELRRDAAIHHLCHSRLSIAEIAARLGFQEPSAFHRAFKKWSGAQPGVYRTLRGGGSEPAAPPR